MWVVTVTAQPGYLYIVAGIKNYRPRVAFLSKKEEGRLDTKYNGIIQVASHYPQALTLSSRDNSSVISSVISEDERPTTRLSSARAKGTGPTEREILYNTASRPDYASAEQPEATVVSELDIDSLREADQLLIETARSHYVFTVVDTKELWGRLAGGMLGNRVVEAYLLPSRVESDASQVTSKSIKAGMKFIFVIEASKGLQRLTTSSVKSLRHRKKSGATTPLKRKQRVTLEQVSD